MKKLNAMTLFLTAALAACAASSEAPATATPVAATSAGDGAIDAQATCVASFVRQRECTDQFIPALVDARVRADKPAGIAAKAQASGRDAIIAGARSEWAEDSKDDAIAANCARMVAALPNERIEGALAQGKACLAETDCDAFVACQLPIIEGMLR